MSQMQGMFEATRRCAEKHIAQGAENITQQLTIFKIDLVGDTGFGACRSLSRWSLGFTSGRPLTPHKVFTSLQSDIKSDSHSVQLHHLSSFTSNRLSKKK